MYCKPTNIIQHVTNQGDFLIIQSVRPEVGKLCKPSSVTAKFLISHYWKKKKKQVIELLKNPGLTQQIEPHMNLILTQPQTSQITLI